MMLFNIRAFADVNRYKYNIIVDGVLGTYLSDSQDTDRILKNNNIKTTKYDIIDDSKKESGLIVVNRYKQFYLDVDGVITKYHTYQNDIYEFMKEKGMKNKELVGESSAIEEHCFIKLRSLIQFTLTINNNSEKQLAYKGESVEEWLNRNKIVIDEKTNVLNINKNSEIQDGFEIIINEIVTRKETGTENINYETEIVYKDDIKRGQSKILQEGIDGEKIIETTYYYTKDSKEPYTNTQKEFIVKKPQNKIIAMSKNNNTYKNIKIGDKIKGHCSHYCACNMCGSGNGNTASGFTIHNGMKNPYIVACNWLPLGSVIEIDGQEYTVVDRGGSRLSHIGWVDIFTPEGHRECYRKGIKNTEIIIKSL